jgi:hypothetical protein
MMPRKPAIPSPEAALALTIGEGGRRRGRCHRYGRELAGLATHVAGWASLAATTVTVGAVIGAAVTSAATGVPVAATVDTTDACGGGVAVNAGGASVAGARVDGGAVTTPGAHRRIPCPRCGAQICPSAHRCPAHVHR